MTRELYIGVGGLYNPQVMAGVDTLLDNIRVLKSRPEPVPNSHDFPNQSSRGSSPAFIYAMIYETDTK